MSWQTHVFYVWCEWEAHVFPARPHQLPPSCQLSLMALRTTWSLRYHTWLYNGVFTKTELQLSSNALTTLCLGQMVEQWLSHGVTHSGVFFSFFSLNLCRGNSLTHVVDHPVPVSHSVNCGDKVKNEQTSLYNNTTPQSELLLLRLPPCYVHMLPLITLTLTSLTPSLLPTPTNSGESLGHHELWRGEGEAHQNHVVAERPLPQEVRRGQRVHQEPGQVDRQQGPLRHLLRLRQHPLLQGRNWRCFNCANSV